MTLAGFGTMIRHEFLLEFRHRFASAALLVYVIAVAFIIYLSFASPEPAVWNALFWMVILFSGLQSGTMAFLREFGDAHLFYYQYVHPLALFLAKILSVWLKLFMLALLAWFVMGVVLGNPIVDGVMFFLAILLGSLGFAVVFTFLSAVALNANNSGLLLAVLGFPVLLPVLLSVMRLSLVSMAVRDVDATESFLMLVAVVMLLIGLGLILFPYLWKN